MSNERFFFSFNVDANKCTYQKILNRFLFFYFIFFNQDFEFTIMSPTLYFCYPIDNIHFEGTVSQILDLGLSFYFMSKNGKLFANFCN